MPNSIRAALLGRNPRGSNINGNSTVQLIDNDHRLFADNRRMQIDMRFAKILRFGATRADIGIDLGNLLNTNYATGYDLPAATEVGLGSHAAPLHAGSDSRPRGEGQARIFHRAPPASPARGSLAGASTVFPCPSIDSVA